MTIDLEDFVEVTAFANSEGVTVQRIYANIAAGMPSMELFGKKLVKAEAAKAWRRARRNTNGNAQYRQYQRA